MSRSIFTRAVLAASFCVVASTQVAFASAKVSSSTKALQALDINDSHTAAGRQHKAQAKATGATCPWANKSDRFDVAAVDEKSLGGSSSNGSAVRR